MDDQTREPIGGVTNSSGRPHQQTQHGSSSSNQVPEHSIDIVPTTLATLPPIEFPKFSGGADNFSVWIYKCTQIFEIYKNIPDQVKLRLSSIHMEGDALRWHRTFMADPKNTAITWKKYVKELENRFGNQIKETGSRPVTESVPPVENRRCICKLQITDENAGEKPEPEDSHFKFGPIYRSNGDEHSCLKEEAWDVVLKNSPDRPAVTTEIYSSAVREIEKEAKTCYPDGIVDSFTGTQFLDMMIKDGCFFLQLALCLLGGSEGLGYPRNHDVFGKSRNHSRFRDVKAWIEAMFFPGNQIPFVVLKVLLKQTYFQNVIKKRKWLKPLEMSKLALYELLLLPELDRQSWGLWRRIPCSRIHWILQQKPHDLLHGFQLLILGPKRRLNVKEKKEEEYEEEEYDTEDQALGAVDYMALSSATELKQSGIHFWNCQGIGSRGINFTNSIFCCCYGYAYLSFPPIVMEDDTAEMLRCLRNYEISRKLSMKKREVCSYIRFMSDLIKTPDDARLMASNGIIQGSGRQKHKLPGILRGLSSKNTDNYSIRKLKQKISDYTPPIWKKYWQVLGLGFVIALVQTALAILDYLKK